MKITAEKDSKKTQYKYNPSKPMKNKVLTGIFY